ncbi:hypothetical protein JCM16106_13520 [Hydrogenophilus islandicus]
MAEEWMVVAKVDEFPVGSYRVVPLDDTEVIVVRSDVGFYAVENRCSHAEVPLAGGTIADGAITCPRHGARFCLKSGAALSPPAVEAIATFPVRVENGVVEVRDARWD